MAFQTRAVSSKPEVTINLSSGLILDSVTDKKMLLQNDDMTGFP